MGERDEHRVRLLTTHFSLYKNPDRQAVGVSYS
jgi:hypothetical protein